MQQQHRQRGSIGGVNPREHAPADPNFAAAAMSQADQWAAIQARQAASADAAARGARGAAPASQTPSPATSGLLSQSLGVGVGHARAGGGGGAEGAPSANGA